MADTIADITMQANTYVDLYTLTGITPGTSLIINNKSSAVVFLQVRASQPSSASNDGWPLRSSPAPDTWVTLTDVPVGSRVWAKGTTAGRLFVQVYEE